MLLQWLLSAWHAVLEVLFPTNCLVCGRKLLDDETIACSDCLKSIPRTEHAILDQNGIDLLFLELIQNQRRTVHYERGAAFAFYNRDKGFALRTLIERGKYGTHPDPQIFYFLGRLAAQEYIDSDLFDDIDYLIEKNKETGFPQKFQATYSKNNPETVFRINKRLNEAGMCKGATLSFQSLSEKVLENIYRKNMSY